MLNKKVIITIIMGVLLSITISSLLLDRNIPKEMKDLFIYKTHTKNLYDIVIVGDSRTYRGITTSSFKETLNKTALNLGYSSGSLSERSIKLAKKKLNPNGSKIIILAITPLSLTFDAAQDNHIESMISLKKEEVLETLNLGLINKLFKSTNPEALYSKLFKSSKTVYYIQNPQIKEGWVSSDFYIRDENFAYNEYKNRLPKTSISDSLVSNLINAIESLSANNYKVFCFYPPSSYNIEQLENNLLNLNKINLIKKTSDKGALWINLDSTYYSYDGSHMIESSGIRLSNEIANKISNNSFIDTNNITLLSLNKYVYSPIYDLIKTYQIETQTKTEIAHFRKNIDQFKANELKQIQVSFNYYPSNKTELYLVCQFSKNDSIFQNTQLNISKLSSINEWNKFQNNFLVPKYSGTDIYVNIFFKNSKNTLISIKDYNINFFNHQMD